MTTATKPPIPASAIPEDWPAQVASALNSNAGQQVRAAFPEHSIEAWSDTLKKFIPLMLPGGGVEFVSAEDRDLVLGAIVGLNVLPRPAPSGQFIGEGVTPGG